MAERLAEFGPFLATNRDAVLPVVCDILEGGSRYSAVDVFTALHRLGELRAEVAELWRAMDLLVLPALGTTFTTAEVLADPMTTNTVLGHDTHFGNLLDLCAAVVPAGLTADGRPAALMILGPALADDRVLALASVLAGGMSVSELPSPPAVVEPRSVLVVVGHHLEGQPRNGDLADNGGYLLARTTTSPDYRLLKVGIDAPVPALVPAPSGGSAIEVESWSVPSSALAGILLDASPSVCLGRVTLADGSPEIGFVASPEVPGEPHPDVTDISDDGGWRDYLAAVAAAP